jgi:hypothetical protein
MTSDAKHKTLACLLGLMLLTAVIAAALPQLELKPGLRLPGQGADSVGIAAGEMLPLVEISISNFWKAVMGILLAAGMVYNVYRLLKDATWNWKDVLRSLLYLIIPVVVFAGLLLFMAGARLSFEAAPAEALPPIVDVKGPPLGPVPAWLIWLICLGLAAALAGAGLWLVFRPAPPDLLKLEAERALQALNTGLDLKSVIVRCYWQMAEVLKKEQGLELETAMTVREFQRLLEARGVPHAPVQQLTQLFEGARYGHQPPGPGDESQAVDCLTAIVRYSQAGKRRR